MKVADTTDNKKRQKKFNERHNDDHSRKHTSLETETDGKMLAGTYGLFSHPMSMITTVGKHLLENGDKWSNVR